MTVRRERMTRGKLKPPRPMSGYVVDAEAVAQAMLRDAAFRRLITPAGGRSPGGAGARRAG